MPFPHGLRALNHREYRRFFVAQLVALVGSWMQTVAQSWLVLQLTDSPFRLGLIGTLQFAPVLLFSIVSGALADRVPKRRVLVITQTVLACQALTLAALVVAGHVRYGHVAVLAVVYGLANALDLPTRQSFVADLVGRADVVNAVALNSAAFNAARIVGPAVGGILIGVVGLAPAFVLNGLGFLVVIAALLGLRADGGPGPESRGAMGEAILTGLRYARRTPRIVLALALLFVVSLCVFNFTIWVPLLARQVLRLGPEGFGFLMAAVGVGSIAGALTLGMLGEEPPLPLLFGAASVALAGLLALGLVRHVWTAVPCLLVTGYFGVVLVAGCNTTMQLTAPDALRGRLMSLYTLVYGGVFPFGAFLVGSISQGWGVSTAFLCAGIFGLLALALVAAWWRARAAGSPASDARGIG